MKPARTTVAAVAAALSAFGLVAAGLAVAAEKLDPIRPDSGFAWIDGDDDVPHVVERADVKKGVRKKGHPRDIIPPIDAPTFYASATEAAEHMGLSDDDRILGMAIGTEARAYATRILDRHEIVNDTVGGKPLAVVW